MENKQQSTENMEMFLLGARFTGAIPSSQLHNLKVNILKAEGNFINSKVLQIITIKKFLQNTICYFSNYRLIQFMGNVFFDQNRFKKYGVQKLPSHNATVKIYYLRYMIRSRRHEASDI